MFGFVKKIVGTKNDREITKLKPMVAKINALEEAWREKSDDDLKAMTPFLKEKLDNGATVDDILVPAFATVRETGRRVLNMRHYDVQLVGGIFLHRGDVAEMRTGEGKTLVATSPLYLNGLTGRGVHLITVNDYLASRDAAWMGEIYRFLGLEVGTIVNDISDNDRHNAYRCDITYGTNNEFGFDYLRDNMKFSLERKVQRDHHYAIVDEVDSILIDEARTPLIISGRAEQSTALYNEINKIIPYLKRDEDYIVDEEHFSATLTDDGVETVEKKLDVDNLYEPRNIEYLHHVNKALQAHTLYKKDVKYIVDEGEVIIVDEHTGRPMPGRRWSDGLHQAVEAKEGVHVKDENQTLATVTFQNFFRMYEKLAGMTGTAETEAEEFQEIYKLQTRVVPTNKPIIRLDENDVIYRTEREKFKAIVDQIIFCHRKGQPLLVGTVSVEKSDAISKVLKRKGISHSVLNAKFHRMEADVVSQAGRKGSITIATNMAGRGTDILLGGNPADLAKKAAGVDSGPDYEKKFEHFQGVCAKEKQEVLDAGGLYILGTERHESRRIDNQLRGRAGRQGDPGGSKFFLSLEDDLMRIFGGERLSGIMERLAMPEGEPIEANMVSKSIESAQRRVEGRNFDIRKNLLEYDDVMNKQREAVYGLRDVVLGGGEPLYEIVLDVFDRVASKYVESYASASVKAEEWDLKGLEIVVKDLFGVKSEVAGLRTRDEIEAKVWDDIEGLIRGKEEELEYIAARSNERFADVEDYEPKAGRDVFIELMQNMYLRSIDHKWREHLKSMDHLRDAIRFHGYAQKDPKKVYKIEGYDQFEKTMIDIDNGLVEYLSKIQVETEEQLQDVAPQAIRIRAVQVPTQTAKPAGPAVAPGSGGGGPTSLEDGELEQASGGKQAKTIKRAARKVGRNEPCPCGSGKKFKHCHMGREDALPAGS